MVNAQTFVAMTNFVFHNSEPDSACSYAGHQAGSDLKLRNLLTDVRIQVHAGEGYRSNYDFRVDIRATNASWLSKRELALGFGG
jgi:hypothetical protein